MHFSILHIGCGAVLFLIQYLYTTCHPKKNIYETCGFRPQRIALFLTPYPGNYFVRNLLVVNFYKPNIFRTRVEKSECCSLLILFLFYIYSFIKVIRIGVIIVDICVLLLLGVALLTAGSTYCLSLLLTLTVENVMSISVQFPDSISSQDNK